jgi:hypothetical protein
LKYIGAPSFRILGKLETYWVHYTTGPAGAQPFPAGGCRGRRPGGDRSSPLDEICENGSEGFFLQFFGPIGKKAGIK